MQTNSSSGTRWRVRVYAVLISVLFNFQQPLSLSNFCLRKVITRERTSAAAGVSLFQRRAANFCNYSRWLCAKAGARTCRTNTHEMDGLCHPKFQLAHFRQLKRNTWHAVKGFEFSQIEVKWFILPLNVIAFCSGIISRDLSRLNGLPHLIKFHLILSDECPTFSAVSFLCTRNEPRSNCRLFIAAVH